jgi:hypothetical protein
VTRSQQIIEIEMITLQYRVFRPTYHLLHKKSLWMVVLTTEMLQVLMVKNPLF